MGLKILYKCGIASTNKRVLLMNNRCRSLPFSNEDRQDGVGQWGTRLSTWGQTSRHSFSEQARPPEERLWININHIMLSIISALKRTAMIYTFSHRNVYFLEVL